MPPPPAHGSIRLPLQVGVTALWSLARCSTALCPGLAIVVAGAYLTGHSHHGGQRGVGVVFLGLMLVAFAVLHAFATLRNRPSDVNLSKDGIAVAGGPHAATLFSWAHVDRDRTRVTEAQVRRVTLFGILRTILTRDMRMGMDQVHVLRLELALRDRTAVALAEAERPIEKESLRALLDTIKSDAWTGEGRPPPANRPPNVLACPQCGAAVAPEDKPSVQCRYCRRVVVVPEDVQERVRAARQVTASKRIHEKLIVGLLRQPGAERTNALLVLLGIPMMLVWPLAFVLAAVRGLLNTIEPVDFLFLALFPLAVILALFTFARARLTDRQALRLLTLNFGAHEPARAGDPYTCRSCSGPLPDAEGKVVVRCAYCGADNVLGIDMRREARPASEEAMGLEAALAQRMRERRTWGMAMGGAAVLLLVGVGSLVLGLGAGPALGSEDPQASPAAPAAAPSPHASPAATPAPRAAPREPAAPPAKGGPGKPAPKHK